MESHVPISVPDLGVPNLQTLFMVFGRARACPANQLRQPIHLAGEEVALWRSPGPVTERLMLHDLVMLEASGRQKVAVDRISFIDALRWLSESRAGASLGKLVVNRDRAAARSLGSGSGGPSRIL